MTLRRKLKLKFEEVLNSYMATGYEYLGETIPNDVLERLADAALEVFNDKPKVDLKNVDPAWSILAGERVETTDSILVYEAKNAFERDLKFNSLPWASTRAWDKMEKFVVEEYSKDKLIFAKYKTWQQNEGKFVAMSNRKIKERPEDFIACWPDFLAHSAMYSPKPRQTDVDDNGIPISY